MAQWVALTGITRRKRVVELCFGNETRDQVYARVRGSLVWQGRHVEARNLVVRPRARVAQALIDAWVHAEED